MNQCLILLRIDCFCTFLHVCLSKGTMQIIGNLISFVFVLLCDKCFFCLQKGNSHIHLFWIVLWLMYHNAESLSIWNKKVSDDCKNSVVIHTAKAFVKTLFASSNKPCGDSLTLLLHCVNVRQNFVFVRLQPGLSACISRDPWLLLSCIVEGIANFSYIFLLLPKLTWLQQLSLTILHHPAEFLHGHLLFHLYKLFSFYAESQLFI